MVEVITLEVAPQGAGRIKGAFLPAHLELLETPPSPTLRATAWTVMALVAPPSLAAQASQLAAAMAAFGGAGGSETGLHTVPAAVQGILAVDPSQTGHATQPLRHAA